jgi:hypothetical protein
VEVEAEDGAQQLAGDEVGGAGGRESLEAGRGAEDGEGGEVGAGEQAGDGGLALDEEAVRVGAVAAVDQAAEAVEARVSGVVDRQHGVL